MAARRASRPRVEPGDTFAERLEDGRWGALRVLRTLAAEPSTALVAVTPYVGAGPPDVGDPLLRRIQEYVWYEAPARPRPCMAWVRGRPPAGLEPVGRIPPTPAEERLGGEDAGWGFGGRWEVGRAWPALRAWQWEHDRAAFDAWQRSSRSGSAGRSS